MKGKFPRVLISLLINCFCLSGCGSSQTDNTTYAVTVLSSENGYVSPNKASAKIGEEITLTAHPNDGYRPLSLTINEQVVEQGFDANNKYVAKMVKDGLVVKADFVKYFSVIFDYPDGQNDVTIYVNEGDKVNRPQVEPTMEEEEFVFNNWFYNDSNNGFVAYDFESPVTKDLVIKAQFDRLVTIRNIRAEFCNKLVNPTYENKYVKYTEINASNFEQKKIVVKGTVIYYDSIENMVYIQEKDENGITAICGFDGGKGIIPFTNKNAYLEIPCGVNEYNGVTQLYNFNHNKWMYSYGDIKVLLNPDDNNDFKVVKLEQPISDLGRDFSDKQKMVTNYFSIFDNYIGDSENVYTIESGEQTNPYLFEMKLTGISNVTVNISRSFVNNDTSVNDLIGKKFKISGIAHYSNDGWTIIPTSAEDLVFVE